MKALLMYPDRAFFVPEEYPFEKTLLLNDLELNVILDAMSKGDEDMRRACEAALLHYCTQKSDILYRQEILTELIAAPQFAREVYDVAVETLYRRKKEHVWLQSQMNALFRGAVEILRMTMEQLKKLRAIADSYYGKFHSKGLVQLIDMLREELSDAYFAEVNAHLDELSFSEGMLISARFGEKLQGEKYTMRRLEKKGLKLKWMFAPSISISSKDEDGLKDLELRKARVISENVNVLAQATDHVLQFFTSLRDELGFYVGCLNLREALTGRGLNVCMPTIAEGERRRTYVNLYDASLPLIGVRSVVGNDMDYAAKRLFVITGANQGGKSTFLRSLGQSQIMLQSGMFVAASSYCSHIASGLFTHFRKEEDAKMDSGKLDEELERMSKIANCVKKGATVLFNESFAATNEREGAEIGRQITQALLESDVEVFSVTHLYQLSNPFYEKKDPAYVFLRAERLSDGQRSFRLSEGEPQRTGYGDDVYRRVFGEE
ncbi:MAG: DNA mismatch repair protein MutS [Eubacteriales bacterium]|nr:DNA mismatch repair protein MutS [Eubacteriales bacterium]